MTFEVPNQNWLLGAFRIAAAVAVAITACSRIA